MALRNGLRGYERLSAALQLCSRQAAFQRLLLPSFCSCKRWLQQHTTSNKNNADKVKGLVYLSTSSDVFANLAFEDWVYNNTDLSETNLMILWRNDPCVVIGRHQNPWAEVDLKQLSSSGVKLARRRSGGGAVYHDLGNLNITFFTSRERYNRPANLELISRAIQRSWPHLSISVTDRDDIVMDDFFKISGTSSKLGRTIAYHHCTLLHSVNKHRLKDLLHVDKEGMTSKATASVRSAVKNLADSEPAICHKSLVQCISTEFYHHVQPVKKKEIYPIDPMDETYWPGMPKLYDDLKSWDWVYGKTPRFSITKRRGAISVIVHVYHAVIEGIIIQAPPGWMDVNHVQGFTEHMRGNVFWSERIAATLDYFLAGSDYDAETVRKLRLLASMLRDAAS